MPASVKTIRPTVVKKVVVGTPVTGAAGDGPLAQQFAALVDTVNALPLFTVSETPPSNPQVGDVWIDISNN